MPKHRLSPFSCTSALLASGDAFFMTFGCNKVSYKLSSNIYFINVHEAIRVADTRRFQDSY